MLGFSPYICNLAGYSVGFLCSFLLSRLFVFPGGRSIGGEVSRYVICFVLAYVANLGALHLCLLLNIREVMSQIISGIVYLVIMFSLSRLWVFK